MPLEKSPLAANGHAIPMKVKVVIQTAFEVEYTCVIEHNVSVSPEARMKILGMDFLVKFGEFFNLRNLMLILAVLPGKCVKLSPFSIKTISLLFTSEFCRVVTRFNNCTILNASFDSYSNRRR